MDDFSPLQAYKVRAYNKQVNSDNDASEVDILGHLRTSWVIWDNSEILLMSLEHSDSFPMHFRPFSAHWEIRRRTDGQTLL